MGSATSTQVRSLGFTSKSWIRNDVPVQNFIYLTVRLLGLIHSTLKYTVTDTSLSLNVNTKECKIAFLNTWSNLCLGPEEIKSANTPLNWIFMPMWIQK